MNQVGRFESQATYFLVCITVWPITSLRCWLHSVASEDVFWQEFWGLLVNNHITFSQSRLIAWNLC